MVGVPGEDDHPALGDPALDHGRGADPVAVDQVRTEQGDLWADALRLGHRVEALPGGGGDPQVGLAVQDRSHRLAEEEVAVGEQDAELRAVHSTPSWRTHMSSVGRPPPWEGAEVGESS